MTPTLTSRPALPRKPSTVREWKLYRSSNPKKKWMVVLTAVDGRHRTIHFGDSSMEDYTQHHDDDRRRRFHQRFAKLIEKTKDDPLSAMYYSAKLLW